MGKRQHQKDKMYLTCTEWSTFYGGKREGSKVGDKAAFRRLPLTHCALSLQPFEHPLCTLDGVVYDLMSIVPFLKQFGVDPATGKPLDAKALIKLNFHKNIEGEFHCPVLFKVFNENSHVVAIRETGNVFSYEAIQQLNFKTHNMRDLLTDEPFSRDDLITIQDPSNLEKFNLVNFHHLIHNMKVTDEEEERRRKDPAYNIRAMTTQTRDILEELKREYKAPDVKEEPKVKADKFNAAHYSTGAVAAAFTSTIFEPATEHEAAVLEDDVVRYSRMKKKGYVQLQTSCGPLNLELHCDATPRTCENFIRLCQKGYYDGTLFHRSIKNFMIQGGDPTATGEGGESAWGKSIKDEIKPNLTHQGRGILSMANSGPNTNKSQFFVTYRSCRHLDGKHTVFGRVVGGLDTLNNMEQVETDNKDRPVEDIKLLSATVFVDPYQEVDEKLAKEREDDMMQNCKVGMVEKKQNETAQVQKVYGQGVGKYINPNTSKVRDQEISPMPAKRKKITNGCFGDFSSW